MRIQWKPNLWPDQRRLILTRIRWERGTVGDGKGYSAKLSISLQYDPRAWWAGFSIVPHSEGWTFFFGLFFPVYLRVKMFRIYGGRFP